MRFRRFVLAALLAVFALHASSAHAVQPDEVLDDPALEARARALSAGLRCLVCQNQSIDDSDAPLAKDLRVLVRERLKAGDSDAEIIAFVVSRYGEFVLLKPRFTPHTWLLWLATPLLFLLALGGIVYAYRRRSASSAAPRALTASEQAHLARLLDEETPQDGGKL
ncbi:cytochrome C biogenesis protein [Methyloceanibacter methanicus]|uniref:Cytochrome c-type biogenesis protein n=1 Tax=Methyloceanibacter methanicus TaxID=1774968 RepID=A0A1E3VY46_9HYPH|nr:cytochrome c-type biogenesis protein [Methyloceanibacter methanicus]ODR98439.1 cytochrome C biogenesis protein [Methyloceanibacter methanicus]